VVMLVRAERELWNVRVVDKVKKEYINNLLDIFEVLPGWRGVGLGLTSKAGGAVAVGFDVLVWGSNV